MTTDTRIDVSGSPCMLHEQLHTTYAGYADRDEVAAFLRWFEREARAVIHGLAEHRREGAPAAVTDMLTDIMRRRVRAWLTLRRHLARLKGCGAPSTIDNTADPAPRLVPATAPRLMAERHEAVAHRIEEALPRIADDGLHADLKRLGQQYQEDGIRLKHLIP